MRYMIGFVLFALALGTLRLVGCSDDPGLVYCEGGAGCDDGNPCTIDRCSCTVDICKGICEYTRIDCKEILPAPFDPQCAATEFEACDRQDGCGEITFINEGERCDADCLFGTEECSSGVCICYISWSSPQP